jgi:histidinol-phosphate/aromatic aminotransferase/cobyric acid decarboxylase-like protein
MPSSAPIRASRTGWTWPARPRTSSSPAPSRKLHGLAALRVGWGYGPSHIIEPIERIRPPFNTSIPGQEAAVAALADVEFQARSVALVEQWRPWLTQQLGGWAWR